MNTDVIAEEISVVTPPRHRRALPWWIQTIVLVIVFLAGGVAGSMVAVRNLHSRMEEYRQHAPLFSQDIVTRLRFRLGLSDRQVLDIQAIVEKRHASMIALRNEGSREMHVEFEAMVEEVTTVLDDPQVARWRAIADHVKRTFLPPALLLQ